ncbi:hypothetical protein ACFE04_009503 [Oxalis oulophora]
MEDDDEFGDLYTDVLKPFTQTTQSQQQQQPIHSFSIDLNLRPPLQRSSVADNEIFYSGPKGDDSEAALVILGDDNVLPNNGIGIGEEQGWGDGFGQGADGERKEGADKGNAVVAAGGGLVVAPKLGGYANHVFHHPFHSQFKYVRPGAPTIPGATTVGPSVAPGQVRPPVNMGIMAGRGRGDWRPTGIRGPSPIQKGWGNNFGGRGFGGASGLDFTLPSHKTIFEVEIDSFEEKPWKYPGVDVSDFFNFGMNEESWKDYCKQLEQHRLETTMQSKIRVYESGRAEKDYDPELPPELAAATSIHERSAENANIGKSDIGQTDVTNVSNRMRPPLPTGRAIQVELGSGERLPTMDTRPPRLRDSDAIIEIPLIDSMDDDDSTKNEVEEQVEPTEDLREENMTDDNVATVETEYVDGFSEAYNGQRREPSRRTPFMGPAHEDIPERNRILPYHSEAPFDYRRGSIGQQSVYSIEEFVVPLNQSHLKEVPRERSPHSPLNRSKRDNQNEDSVESMDAKHSPKISSPARELSVENKIAMVKESVLADGNSEMDMEGMTTSDNPKDVNMHHSIKKLKTSYQLEKPKPQELDEDGEGSKAARSSENSKARSGSSKDYPKRQESGDEEVVQAGRSKRPESSRKHFDEEEPNFRRKNRDERQVLLMKGRDDHYPYRDMKTDFDRRKESFEDPYNRKGKYEDGRKRERFVDEIGYRQHKGRLRQNERSDIYPIKQLDNGNYRAHYEEEVGFRHKFEIVDEYHGKRRKDAEFFRRDLPEKEELFHRETSGHRKRERDSPFDIQKREDHLRVRESFDDHHSIRHKDLPRHRLKQSYGENLAKREREEPHIAVRSGRGSEYNKVSDKDYQLKDMARHGEQMKRRDRVEDGSSSYHKGREDTYAQNEERKSRQGRSSSRSDRAVNTSESQRVHDKKHKESSRKNKDHEGGDGNGLISSKRNRGDPSGQINEMALLMLGLTCPAVFGCDIERALKGASEQLNGVNETLLPRNASRKQKEEGSSDDEQRDSRRGRSKFERWMSHKERDFSINSKSSTSLNIKEIDKNKNSASSEAGKVIEEPMNLTEGVDIMNGLRIEKNDSETMPLPEEKPLDDTVEKLKKRSERFKLPISSDNNASSAINEAFPPVKSEGPANADTKSERPPRKRRWVAN